MMSSSKLFIASIAILTAIAAENSFAASWVNSDVYSYSAGDSQSVLPEAQKTQSTFSGLISPSERFWLNRHETQPFVAKNRSEVEMELAQAAMSGDLNSAAQYYNYAHDRGQLSQAVKVPMTASK